MKSLFSCSTVAAALISDNTYSVQLSSKVQNLEEILQRPRNLLVAYSGGVDSALLLWKAHQTLGARVRGVLADSPSLSRREYQQALDFASFHNLPLQVIHTDETSNPEYQANPLNRCYFCKHELFDKMNELAVDENFAALAYGENADDAGDFRPGQKAATEFEVLAPLREAGLTKSEVRALARKAGLDVHDKVAQPCLASRIPHGQKVEPSKFVQIEAVENALTDEGFRVVRVRHHGERAIIQVSPEETPRLNARSAILRPIIEQAGFSSFEIDPQGYRGAGLR